MAWAEQVANTRVHAETKTTPIARFLADGPPERPDPAVVREAFRWSVTRRVTKTATVSLFANRYGVEPFLIGRAVELRFDPEDLAVIDVVLGGQVICQAVPYSIGRHVHPAVPRQDERRVGKECRSRWSAYHLKKNNKFEEVAPGAGMQHYAADPLRGPVPGA